MNNTQPIVDSSTEHENDLPDSLDYPEQGEKANEYLRLVLAMLSQLHLVPNPVNFTLCYEYVSKHNEELCGALRKVLTEKHGLTKGDAISLYQHYIWDEDRRLLENQRTELRRLMTETLSGVEESAEQASQSSQVLGDCSKKLEINADLQEMRNVVAEVITETKSMAFNSHQLKDMLVETKLEVENLREELEQSRQQATTDSLTGLLNRRAFDNEMSKATEDANLSPDNLSLLIIDIDHFKRVNDSHGHLIGDKVIRFIATQLSSNVKGRDIVARIGGEEFAVLLPNTQVQHAKIVAESIRSKIEKSQLKRLDNRQPIGDITVSIGTACYKQGEPADDFFHRADKALYQSKDSGRNKVSVLF
ncbi:MAG: GGDEF domain-containing protein [Pseudomonadota bacterium]